jgi:excisionase family DNA binding protein
MVCRNLLQSGMAEESRDLTVDEAAKAMRTHPETIRRWLRAGLLPGAYKTAAGHSWRIPSADLEAIKQKHAP